MARREHGKSGRYRYYTCCTKARQGETGCPKRLEQLLSDVLDRRTERAERRKVHIAELRKRAAEADAKLKRMRSKTGSPIFRNPC
ncbi:MAG: hypothetical protein AB1586_20275 [Pseudomonadota bacterium]